MGEDDGCTFEARVLLVVDKSEWSLQSLNKENPNSLFIKHGPTALPNIHIT